MRTAFKKDPTFRTFKKRSDFDSALQRGELASGQSNGFIRTEEAFRLPTSSQQHVSDMEIEGVFRTYIVSGLKSGEIVARGRRSMTSRLEVLPAGYWEWLEPNQNISLARSDDVIFREFSFMFTHSSDGKDPTGGKFVRANTAHILGRNWRRKQSSQPRKRGRKGYPFWNSCKKALSEKVEKYGFPDDDNKNQSWCKQAHAEELYKNIAAESDEYPDTSTVRRHVRQDLAELRAGAKNKH